MKTIHKLLATVLLLIAITSSQKVLANASQPGVWNAGGTVFTMLYPEDSLTFKKVQMQQERIYIQLYKGYAVVKGVYLFRNTTNENLNFKMGYPVNGIYSGGDVDLNQVTLDSLSRFKIKTKNEWLSLLEQPNGEYGKINSFSDNWMVWQMEFSPAEVQTVEVYFIVNTNEAKVRKGYNTQRSNAFIYLLESGSVWKQPIEKGDFIIQLKDGLTQDDVRGISNGFVFQYSTIHNIYWGTKNRFSPTPKDNLVVTYHQHNGSFNFDAVRLHAETLYSEIDMLSQMKMVANHFKPVQTKSPYDIKNTFSGVTPGLLTVFIALAPFIIGGIVGIIIIWSVVRWVKIKRLKTR